MNINRILLTGALGRIGTHLRPRLAKMVKSLRSSDILQDEARHPNEEWISGDLADADFVREMVQDCDAIVHLGGISSEADWDSLLATNISGLINLYDAARDSGVKRIIYASSNHVVGFHESSTVIDADAPVRADTRYGVSKVFGEALARYHYDQYGTQSLLLRIGACYPVPTDDRALRTWFSHDDLESLIEKSLSVEHLGCPIAYGVSENKGKWWVNNQIDHLNWQPLDSSEPFRAEIEADTLKGLRKSTMGEFQGGNFVSKS